MCKVGFDFNALGPPWWNWRIFNSNKLFEFNLKSEAAAVVAQRSVCVCVAVSGCFDSSSCGGWQSVALNCTWSSMVELLRYEFEQVLNVFAPIFGELNIVACLRLTCAESCCLISIWMCHTCEV